MTTQNTTDPEEIVPVDPNTKAVANAATQTLFRFVSMRNPQLAKKEGNLKFIFRKEEYKGVFDELLKEWKPELQKSKIDFLTEKVKSPDFNFGYIQRTEKAIKEWFGNFYTSSKNLIANGALPAQEVNELNGIIVDYSNDPEKTKKFFGGLWDSIIYQVITQEDFYVKEILLQILQTIHYTENYNSFSTETDPKKKEEQQKEIATAKAVIPDYLLIDSATDDGEETTSAKYFTVGESEVGGEDYISGDYNNQALKVSEQLSYQAVAEMGKRQNVALATYRKQQLESLKKELLKAQKQYRKNYQKNYDAQYQKYQNEIKPEQENYQERLLEAEAALEEGANKASKDLALKRVEKPNIPDFEFDFENEFDYLQKRLSENALESLSGLIGKMEASKETDSPTRNPGQATISDEYQEGLQIVFPEDEYQSFDEILELLEEKLTESNDEIYQNTEVEKQQYASVGGVLIPVNKSSTQDLVSYQVCTVNNYGNLYGITFTLNVPNITEWDVKALLYTIKNQNIPQGNTNGYFQKSIIGNTIYLKNLFGSVNNIGDLDGDKYLPGTLDVVITFVNGKKITFTAPALSKDSCVQGSFSVNDGSGNPDNPSTPVSTNNSFVPNGFGIKRLGIADYLKVEQTTHAYVEGEVANIENIMAREYRSQSTRRLSRSETTDTSSSDTEREKSTDTTTSSRFEMQSEISQILQEATDMGINANTSYTYGNDATGHFGLQIGGSYANHRSKEDSMRQAVTQAQEVTARALDRVVTKVHQERVEKMIEEFEENNTHGFDNRKGDQHVVGVYRWVDKLMKNRVWNYGKRMMFEFAIPRPSKLHMLAAASIKGVIDKPVDPRKANQLKIADYTQVSDDTIKYWGGVYNVEIENLSPEVLKVTKAFAYGKDKVSDIATSNTSAIGIQDTIKIPEGYTSTYYSISGGGKQYLKDGSSLLNINIGDLQVVLDNNLGTFGYSNFLNGHSGELAIGISTDRFYSFETVVTIDCQLSSNSKKQWQQKTFNAIIKAYEDALADYNNKVAEENAKANNIKDGNPMFYRQIEQEVLKHNSIAYLVDDSFSKDHKVLGKDLYKGDTVEEFEVTRIGLDDYASLAKFMEQAFEWDIMSYNYYPYYWGKREDWDDMYQQENIDPLFRSFLRSGMARVVVTVRPGFEDAVQFYMSTGRLWNGGEVPVIGDPMYLSLVDEMKDVKGEAQGKPWITRLPTSLTILQAESIGLKVLSALPFTKEDPALFENPEEVITVSNFIKTAAMIESGTDKQVTKIGLDEDSLLLATDDDQIVSELPLEELKKALE